MLEDGRIMELREFDHLHSVLFFSVTNFPDDYLKKGMWEYKEDDPSGDTFYIEKIFSKGWSKKLTMKVNDLALASYPSIKFGAWDRYGIMSDRRFTMKVRRHHAEHTN